MSELETETAVDADAETAELVLVEPDAPDHPGELEVRDDDADLLSIPPRVDDLGVALRARPPRVKLPRVTTALVAAALLCGGFIGGVLVEKHYSGGSSGSGRGAGFAAAFGGSGGGTGTGTGGRTGRGSFGGFGGSSGAGGAITGTVTVVSGNTLYITAADGSVYTVTTTGSTTVSIAQSGSLSQLKPGQTVVVSGSGDSNGNVTATSITEGTSSPKTSNTTPNPTSTGGQ